MKKQMILIIFLIVFTAFSTFSCDFITADNSNNSASGKDNNEDNNTDNFQPNEDTVWSEGIVLKILINSNSELQYYDIAGAVYSHTGETPKYVSDTSLPSDHEFIFGEMDRELYKKAYQELCQRINTENGEEGWIAYTDGRSIAFAYSGDIAMRYAIEYIKSVILTEETLKYESVGIAAEEKFLLAELADEVREKTRGDAFTDLENEVGKEITDQLRNLYTLYTDDIYVWLANLYDPITGGFYFSNTGRDNYTYLPDIESTVQVLNHLRSGGMFDSVGGSYATALSEDIKAALLNFAKGLQSSKDGYFYHPQWGEDIIDARRGRDLGWATQLIKALGGKPKWTTPGGVEGELGAPGASTASALTARLTDSGVCAVSKLVSVTAYLPEHLRSLDKWETYIIGLDICDDPYTAGNTLAAQHNEISAAGEEYIDYLTNYLTIKQNKETGFWGEGVSYVTMNGFMKLSHSYTYYDRVIPEVEKALASTIEILLTTDTDEVDLHVCNTYNTWVNFSQILDSAKETGGEELVASLRAIIFEKAPDLIKITYDKILTHKRTEGGFSYFEKKPCNASQKAPVACATSPESDVNATAICTTGIVTNIFTALGVKKVPLYCDIDYVIFSKIIENRDPIVKNAPEDIDYPTLTGERGTGKYYESSTKYGSISPPSVTTPTAKSVLSNTEDKYVYFYKNIAEDGVNKQDEITFTLPVSIPEGASGVIFELDIAFCGFSNYTGSTKAAGMQINMYDGEELTSIYFKGEEGSVSTVNSSVLDGNNISLEENKWYNLRFETYACSTTRAVKLYVNGVYTCTLKSADDTEKTAKRVSIILRQYDTDDAIAIDNVYAGYVLNE
ncbi:MAG: hypothetical protein IJX92_06635 [Clostridia bacterium]|nr:hypothetical protein [Clostridia bacterium]